MEHDVSLGTQMAADACLAEPARGATEGPLAELIPWYVDIESWMDEKKGISLNNMTLRQYAAASWITSISIAIGDEAPTVYACDANGIPIGDGGTLIPAINELARDPAFVFVAHNAAFDARMIRFKWDVPHPRNVFCTLEGSMGAWPELVGGYSLFNIGHRLNFAKTKRKFDLNLKAMARVRDFVSSKGPMPLVGLTDFLRPKLSVRQRRTMLPEHIEQVEADAGKFAIQLKEICRQGKFPLPVTVTVEFLDNCLAIYNLRDTVALQETYQRVAARLPVNEQKIALITNRMRAFYFNISQENLSKFSDILDKEMARAEKDTIELLTGVIGGKDMDSEEFAQIAKDAAAEIFNRDRDENNVPVGAIKSVRPQRMKKVIDAFFDTKMVEEGRTTSQKKMNPVWAAENPLPAAVINHSGRVNKMRSHKQRSGVFVGVPCVDVELGAFRAHTFRFSSPSVGKGLNLHNCVRAGSAILTHRGWVLVTDIRADDLIWDGNSFVRHGGVTYEGERDTMPGIAGCGVTGEHPVWVDLDPSKATVPRKDLTPWQHVLARAAGLGSILRALEAPLGRSLLFTLAQKDMAAGIACLNRVERAARLYFAAHEAGDAGPSLLPLIADLDKVLALFVPAWQDRSEYLATEGSYVRDTTGKARFSNRAVFDILDVGLNKRFQCNGSIVGNCPKHDKLIAKPVRQLFRLPDHLCAVRADLANVEYRCEGYLTECKTIYKMFDPGQGGNIFTDPYCEAWYAMTKMKITKADAGIRQVSKCLAEGTPVWTQRGQIAIEDVRLDDMVFDGEHWVTHRGVVFAGKKDVVCVNGVWMTLDHRVLIAPGEWREAWELCVNTHYLEQATALALGYASTTQFKKSSTQKGTKTGSSDADATCPATSKKSPAEVCSLASQPGATGRPSGSAISTATKPSSPMTSCAKAGSAGTRPSWDGATGTRTPTTPATAGGASLCARNGTTEQPSSASSSPWRTGTLTGPSSTGETTTKGTSPRTFESLDAPSRTGTSETTGSLNTRDVPGVPASSGNGSAPSTELTLLSPEKSEKEWGQIRSLLSSHSVEVRTSVPTYDVAEAGPLTRFMCGNYVVVHNSAVLGLGFLMGVVGYAKVLLKAIADSATAEDPKDRLTEAGMQEIIKKMGWGRPSKSQMMDRAVSELGCSEVIALASFHIHRSFNEAHPEFGILGDWLFRCVNSVASSLDHSDAQRRIEQMYLSTAAPDRNKLNLQIDTDWNTAHPSIRVSAGLWNQTVTWREPFMRRVMDDHNSEPRLTILKSSGLKKPVTKNVLIENVTQAMARNALCNAILELDRRGFGHVLHIHDELMIIVPRNREQVLAAKQALLDVLGPKGCTPYGWATLVKPEEITVTQSLWEEEDDISEKALIDKKRKLPDGTTEKYQIPGGRRWSRIENNEPGCLEGLP